MHRTQVCSVSVCTLILEAPTISYRTPSTRSPPHAFIEWVRPTPDVQVVHVHVVNYYSPMIYLTFIKGKCAVADIVNASHISPHHIRLMIILMGDQVTINELYASVRRFSGYRGNYTKFLGLNLESVRTQALGEYPLTLNADLCSHDRTFFVMCLCFCSAEVGAAWSNWQFNSRSSCSASRSSMTSWSYSYRMCWTL